MQLQGKEVLSTQSSWHKLWDAALAKVLKVPVLFSLYFSNLPTDLYLVKGDVWYVRSQSQNIPAIYNLLMSTSRTLSVCEIVVIYSSQSFVVRELCFQTWSSLVCNPNSYIIIIQCSAFHLFNLLCYMPGVWVMQNNWTVDRWVSMQLAMSK